MSWTKMISFIGLGKPKGLHQGFASSYIKTVKTLSRKHKLDDADEVKRSLRVLESLSTESLVAGRGEVWIPEPDEKGFYPIIEKVPYPMVKRAIRKNTSEGLRRRAWGAVERSTEQFRPLFSRRPGTLTEAQRRSLLSHAVVSLPLAKGRYPALLGKRVPGELSMVESGSRSVIPIKSMAPEDWARGFTPRKFNLGEEITRRMKVKLKDPVVPNPNAASAARNLKDLVKMKPLKVTLEPDNVNSQDYELLCYENGFRARLKRGWRRMKRHLLGETLPVAARGATMGTLGLIQQEVGLLVPTTVDMVPITRVGLKKDYLPFTNLQLTQMARGLVRRARIETNPITREALGKKVADLAVEIAGRRAM